MGSWAGWAGFVPGYQGNSGGPGRWRRVQVQTNKTGCTEWPLCPREWTHMRALLTYERRRGFKRRGGFGGLVSDHQIHGLRFVLVQVSWFWFLLVQK